MGNVIKVGDYKVFKDASGEEYICCPHAPDWDGTVIDWLDLKIETRKNPPLAKKEPTSLNLYETFFDGGGE